MADLGVVAQMAYDIYEALITGLLYAGPFLLLAIILGGVAFFLFKRKAYNVDCVIDDWTSGNRIRRYDKGGIFKMRNTGVEEFRFKKLKKKTRGVPERKYMIVQDNRRFGIHFDRWGEDDFAVRHNTAEISRKAVKFKVIDPHTKDHLIMQAKNIALKNKRQKTEWYNSPGFVYGSFAIMVIFCIIWYFKYAGALADKQLSCITLDACKAVVNQVCNVPDIIPEATKNPLTQAVTG